MRMNNPSDLVARNVKLVYYIVSHEYPKYLHDDDLVQAGMLGLCEAANRWDESKSAFGTFAGNWIRGEIKKEFVRRKKNSGVWSTDRMIGDDEDGATLEELLGKEDDTSYINIQDFRDTLHSHEQEVFDLRSAGLNTEEIAEKTNRNIQTVQRITRNIRRKAAREDEYGYSYKRSTHPSEVPRRHNPVETDEERGLD